MREGEIGLKIDTELTHEEADALATLMSSATAGAIYRFRTTELGKVGIRVLNKLFANAPYYRPYDENGEDFLERGFPFPTTRPPES